MREIARASVRSTAPADAFFRRWCDLESHPEWAPSMEYFRLRDPFAVGAHGVLKAVGGEEAEFTVTTIGPGCVYADTTALDGAELTVHHEAVTAGATTIVTLTAWVTGPRTEAWVAQLGDEVQVSLDRDLVSLTQLLEREHDAQATNGSKIAQG